MSSLVALPDAEASSSLTKGMPRFTETFKLHRQGTTSLQSNSSQEKSALSRHKEEEFDAQQFDEYVFKIWEERAEDFKIKSKNVRQQLKEQASRYIIDPRTCQWLFAWDFTSFVCLGFTAVCTPVEVC